MRPFTGSSGLCRTKTERLFSASVEPTILDVLTEHCIPAMGVGKISDIFAGRGYKSHSYEKQCRRNKCHSEFDPKRNKGSYFCNLVDFDMLYGHRNDIKDMLMRWRRWIKNPTNNRCLGRKRCSDFYS